MIITDSTRQFFRPLALQAKDVLHLDLNDDGTKFVADIYQPHPWEENCKALASIAASRTFIGRVPERKKLLGLCRWEFAATDFTAQIIDALWPPDQIHFETEAKLVYDYLLTTMKGQALNTRDVAQYRADKTVPHHTFDLHEEFPLSPYQQIALLCSARSEGYALFMEQGTGKTPIPIARICNEAKKLAEGKADHKTIAIAEKKGFDLVAVAEQEASKFRRQKLKEVESKAISHRENLRKACEERNKNKAISLNCVAVKLISEAQAAIDKIEQERLDEMATAMRQAGDYALKIKDEANQEIDRVKIELVKEAKQRSDKLVEVARDSVSGNREPRMYKTIVVCPKGVRMNWEEEVHKFATVKGKVTVLRGGELKRTKQLIDAFSNDDDSKFTLVVCSYETLCVSWNVLKMVQWDLAILDESHMIKTPTTRRFKHAIKLRDRADNRMVLTGTPITNSWLDVYTQFEFLGLGWSGFNSWRNFRSFYGHYKPTESGHQVLIGSKNLPFMQERLARLSFIIRKTEALPDLPEKVYDLYEVEMGKEQSAAYDQIRKHLMLEIEQDLKNAGNRKAMVISNVLTKLLRLAQVTSGFVTWDPVFSDEGDVLVEKEVSPFDPNPKLEALVEILKEKGPNDKTIIWACWVQDIREISARLHKEGIGAVKFYGATSDAQREIAVHDFNHDINCKVFIGNPAAGGTGLNLLGYPPDKEDDYETNCNHEIYFSQNWSSTARSQSEDRAHRRGTRTNIRITDLCVPQSIDEEIRVRVMKKRMIAMEISDIRSILDNVLKGVRDE